MVGLSRPFGYAPIGNFPEVRRLSDKPRNPEIQRLHLTYSSVWALPISLAATLGIAVDFFS
jgi:hypothetical protein